MSPIIDRPPRWARQLLAWFHPKETIEEVEGDLEELYAYWYQRAGKQQATLRYLLNVFSVLPPFVRRRLSKPENQLSSTTTFRNLLTYMFRNNSKQLRRRLVNDKTYTLLNIVGLSVGLTCFAFIALWVQNEVSYDTFHEHYDRIVRVTSTEKTNNGISQSARTSAPMAKAIQEMYDEVEKTVRLERRGEIVQFRNQQLLEPEILLTDPSFFDVFSYKLLKGNVVTALKEPYSIILTQSAAQKYFGNTNPMGQALTIYMYDSTSRGANYTVTGIVADPPKNGHFSFSMLGSFKTIEAVQPNILTAEGWKNNNYFTYILLKQKVNTTSLAKKISQLYQKHIGETAASDRPNYSYELQPLREIHLKSRLEREIGPTGTITQVYIFSIIGIFILLLAGINYTNLATARSVGRAKEISIKKVAGAIKSQLIISYLSESVFLTLLALVLALLAAFSLEPFFYQLTGKALSLQSSPLLLLFLTGVTLLLGILSGLYPAFILSSFKPASVLKGAFKSSTKGIVLRKSLIVFQFAITLLLVSSIMIIYIQMNYIQQKDLGFKKEALVFLRLNGNAEVIKGYDAFRNDLKNNPHIGGVATSRAGILNGLEKTGAESRDTKGNSVQVNTLLLQVDEDYPSVYGLQVVAGNTFTSRAVGDTLQQIILNERAVRAFGWKNAEDAIGKPFLADNTLGKIVGVVRDFHYHSLQHAIEPAAISLRGPYFGRITIKINGNTTRRGLAEIEKTWKKHFPIALFDYDFFDQLLKEQYRAEEQFSTLILYFSVLSLLIACLGVYGLIAYSTSQKTKEIGIRKTLGASVTGIVVMLTKDVLKPVGIACCIAMPVAWYLMNEWLLDFAYRIHLSWWMFAASIGLVLLITLFTISLQTIKAALMNPVKALHSE